MSAMADDTKAPPDFAMLRAVEILAQLAERLLKSTNVLPPPLDVPLVLFNENLMFVIGKTPRANVIKTLGAGYAFPYKGWETYATREGRARCLLSALYRDDVLAGIDYFIPKPSVVPELGTRSFGDFRLVPGQIAIGNEILRLDERFVSVDEGPDAQRYAYTYVAPYPGGIAFVQSNSGLIERIVLFAVDKK
jgi:hypothetical protein